MNTLKSSWKTVLAALISFLLGAALFHSPSVRAQGKTVVSIHRVNEGNGFVSIDATSQVVGFTCVQTRQGEPVCYVASR
jgi:hypothetical protein